MPRKEANLDNPTAFYYTFYHKTVLFRMTSPGMWPNRLKSDYLSDVDMDIQETGE